MIKRLDWDSNFFGYRVGKLDYYKSVISLHDLRDLNHYDLVYLYAHEKINEDRELPNPFTKVIFSTSLDETNLNSFERYENISELDLKNIKGEDWYQLIGLGYQSGIYSRFKLDRNFSESEFQDLYKKWIENSINQKIADQIIVSRDNGNNINGFITISHDKDGTQIGLFAVSYKSRRKGIGSKLISASKYLAKKNNSEKLTVATQQENTKACDFYFKNGFKKKKSIDIYHLWQL